MNERITDGNVNELKLLKAHPELLNFHGIGGGTWLHQAASRDNVAMVQMLVEEGIDVNSPRQDDPENPLDEAASSGSLKVARWLLDNGAKIDNRGGTRGTTLIGAVNSGSAEIVKLLLERVEDVNVTYGKPPKNALGHALLKGNKQIIELLRARGAVEPKSQATKQPGTIREEILQHVARYIGPVRELELTEIVPGGLPIAIHEVAPGKGRPHITLFTTGMSARAMTVPEDGEYYRFAELLIRLPSDWPLTLQALEDPNNYWPIEWMRRIAQYPHENDTWLGGSHAIIANEEPPEPFAPNVGFTCMLLLTEDTKFGRLKAKDGRIIIFYTMVPLYTEERDLEATEGDSLSFEAFPEIRHQHYC